MGEVLSFSLRSKPTASEVLPEWRPGLARSILESALGSWREGVVAAS